jgi:hypothetical protein
MTRYLNAEQEYLPSEVHAHLWAVETVQKTLQFIKTYWRIILK